MENNTEFDNPEVLENDTENLAEKFSKSVIRKNVHAKLPRGTKISGVEINPYYAGDFYDHGPDKIKSLGGDLDNFYGKIIYFKEKVPEIVNSHILCVNRSMTNEENKILTIRFFQDNKIDSRGYAPGEVQFEFSNTEANKFLEEIPKNPDLLEALYQKAYNELDSTSEHPGLRRVKADGFYLITESDIKEIQKINENYMVHEKKTKDFFKKRQKYHYKNGPYGSGIPYNPTMN